MNGTYYPNPTFPTASTNNYQEDYSITKELSNISDIESILRINKGKKVNIYVSYPNDEKNITYSGIIEQVGKDNLIISNPETGNWYLLLTKYLNYIEFEEKIFL